ncbi:Vacuolar morphoproteinsis protein 6 [Rhodotorula kratochvilovae]
MHAPFSLSPLIRPDVLGSEPVTASLLHADRIVLGTERGTLLVFDLSRASSSLGPPSATLVNRHDGFSKKPIEQLGVIKELNALVCLSGGDLTLHSFPDLAVLSTFASQTRGTASLFALCTEIHHPASSSAAPGIPEIHTTLALACKRRLLLLSWVDGTWNPQVEVSLPHQVRGMAFDSRRLVCGFSTGDYGVVTLPSLDEDGSKMHPVLGELFNLPLVLPERPSQSSVRGLGGFTTGLGNVVGLGALGALAKKLEKNGVVGVPRLSRKGKLPQRSASGVPDKQDDGKAWLWGKEWGWEDEEVTDGEVFVVRDRSLEQTLWIATMEPWQAQLEELGEQGRWEEGIRLLRGSFDVISESLPPPLSRRLAILHSLHLFETHRYALAIDAFIALDLNPARVVSLYPRAISGKLFLEHSHEEVFGGRPQHKVAAALEAEEERRREEEERKKLEREQEAQAKGSPAASSPAKRAKGPLANAAAAEDDDAASIRSVGSRLGVKRSWLRERDTGATLDEIADQAAKEQERQAKADAQNRSRAVEELIRYLTDRRQKYSQAFAALLPSSCPSPASPRPPAPPSELFDLPNEPLTKLAPAQLARVAQVVDTALFRAYLATKPVMVGPLCRIENWGEVEEVEELLLDAKKYRELLDLYNGKNMHEKAVELLKQMSEDEDDPEEKVGPTVRYLQKLGADHVEVIFEASKWVFEQDSTAGLQIFVADLEEVETLPRHAVMAHLEKVGRDVCIRYLEHIIHELGEQGADFHEKLVELYLAAVQAPPSGRDGTAYKKVLDLLESSTSYRPDRMLGRLPSEDMHEVRAILLGRLGRHEGALQIYVYQLEDHATAKQYCKRVYDSDEAMRPTIFHLLLRLYLRPRPNHPLLFTPALSLLSTQAARIDPIEAFDLLPPLVALGDIKVYLEKTLRKSNERAREAKMVKALGRSWLDQQEREVVDLEERRVKITEGRVCPVCHKRIGNSVIAIHNPHGVVTHYQCREQYQEERA